MRRVEYKEPDDAEEYKEWKKKAAEETRKAIEAFDKGEPYKFNREVWSQMKEHLFRLFDNKCAYCESRVRHVAAGDVEHFRPKAGVTEDAAHPGYYWLAYDLKNLLPSCERCNRAGGKMNHFPVEANLRVHSHTERVDEELALLLNPYKDEPSGHLKFAPPIDPENAIAVGTVVHLTRMGEESIKVYNLNRQLLTEERREAQEKIVSELETALIKRKLGSVWKDLKSGRRAYSAALLVMANSWWDSIKMMVEET
jgi:uncharacterized protein (TIGR02646 family)